MLNSTGTQGQSSKADIQANTTGVVGGHLAFAAADAIHQVLAPGNVSNSIWFKVGFSSQPQLQVTYLTSYRLFGVVELAIYNSVTSSTNNTALALYVLDARTPGEFYSIPRTTLLVPSTAPAPTRGHNVQRLPSQVQQGEYVVAVRPVNGTNLQGSKFKLLGILSC